MLTALALDDSLPHHAVASLSQGVSLLAKIRDDWLHWYRSSELDAAAFGRVHSQWLGLLQEEERWRTHFNGSGNRPWPDSTSLRAAANEARRNGLAKLFRSIGNRTSSLATVSADLQLPQRRLQPNELDGLASHVDALIGFRSLLRGTEAVGSTIRFRGLGIRRCH